MKNNNNILFICALPEEQQALLEKLGNGYQSINISSKLSLSCFCYTRGNLNIYVTLSGMGNVNAGSKLVLILEQFPIDQIILLGVGGALHSDLNIGDMVISDSVIQHDYCSSLDEGRFLMRPGDLILNEEQSHHYSAVVKSTPHHFPLTKLFNPNSNNLGVIIHFALVASGSEFVGTSVRKQQIYQQCNKALLVDMEASAVASIANQYNVPFIVAKTVSDKLYSDGSIGNDFDLFLTKACQNAASVALSLISQYQS